MGQNDHKGEPRPESLKRLLSFRSIYREQYEMLVKLAPFAFVTNAVVTLFTLVVFWRQPGFDFAVAWTSISVGLTFVSLVVLFRAKSIRPSDDDLPRIAQQITMLSALRGLLWAVAFTHLMPLASQPNQLVLGWTMIGLICGGIFAYWSLPAAAMSFSGIVAIGGSIGILSLALPNGPLTVLAIWAYYALLGCVSIWNAALVRKQVRIEKDMINKNSMIALLLTDFENNANSWLWQTDHKGHMLRGHTGFSKILGLTEPDLVDLSLCELLRGQAKGDAQAGILQSFTQKMLLGEAFGGLIIELGEGNNLKVLELAAKPSFSPEGTLIGWHGVASDITMAHTAEARMQYMASHDTLTGLPNRFYFQEQIEQALKGNSQENEWLLYLDLDGFKSINDAFGHLVGDALLCAVVARLRHVAQACTCMARIGGDEFVILAKGPMQNVRTLCNEIVSETLKPFDVEGQMLYVGVSIGGVPLFGSNCDTNELMRRADLALYRAKNEGRSMTRFYDDTMDAALQRKRLIEQQLRQAIERKEFSINYQPIFNFKDQALKGYEALLRWDNQQFGAIGPEIFISIAEDAGLIPEIGRWVLDEACQEAMNWDRHVSLSVNVSPLQLRNKSFLADIVGALANSGLAPHRLELELTENALIENSDLSEKMIADIKLLGVRVALDDFGMGYSSLAYLHKFKFDMIKIDRTFVQSYESRRESAAVINAVMMLARELGIATTAEGIETVEQFNALAAIGCDHAQGFLMGRPKPIEQESQRSKINTWPISA